MSSINLGQVKTIVKSVDSLLEPVEIYQQLQASSAASGSVMPYRNSMLLESSEIDSKENVKSILMLSAALRIECNGRIVQVKSQSENGNNALSQIANVVSESDDIFEVSTESEDDLLVLNLEYAAQQQNLDEDSRLKSASPINFLRLIRQTFTSVTANDFAVFLCGVFAFDFIATFENLPNVEPGNNTCPDYVFYLAETLLIIDHKNNSKRLMSNQFAGDNQEKTYFQLSRQFAEMENQINSLGSIENQPNRTRSSQAEYETNLTDEQYAQVVNQLKTNIVQGDVFQVVPSRTFSLDCQDPLASYRELKKANPSPYLFYMQDQDFVLFGASPESALKYDSQSNQVLLYPIAGTRPRGKSATGEINLDLDARIEAELKLDHKEIAEHMMLVDLARNDIARISIPGTTYVPRLLAVDRYSQVMHLVSCVKGELNPQFDALHAYQACMNMGTLTGAPKVKATQLIRNVEQTRRGSYGGAVGYINGKGDMDTCIVIRSAFYKNGRAYIQAGAGIVYDSEPLMEAKETRNKAMAVIRAIHSANKQILDSNKETEIEELAL